MPKIDFTLSLWAKTGSIFEGVQVLESKVVKRPVKYNVFPSKEGVPIIILHEDEWKIIKNRKRHKKVIGEIINKLTEDL